jgi:hypothetical protein
VLLSAVLVRNKRLAAGLLAGFAVATLAACGSQSDSSGGSTTAVNGNSNTPGGGTAMSAYFQCLRQNGVTVGRPGGGAAPSGAPGGAAPSGAPGGGNGGPAGNGKPPSGAPGGGDGGPGGAMTISKPNGVADAVWTKAQAACSSLAPAAAPTASAGS